MKYIKSLISKPGQIFYSFLFSYIIVLLIPLLFGIVIYYSSFTAAKSEAQVAYMSMLAQTRASIDGQINEIKKYAATFITNKNVQSQMYIHGVPTPKQTYNFSLLQKELTTYKFSYSLIKDIDIYFPYGNYVLGTRARYPSEELPSLAQIYYHMDIEQWLDLSSDILLDKYIPINNGQGKNDLLYILQLGNPYDKKQSAFMFITLDSSKLFTNKSNQNPFNIGELYLSWENGLVMDSTFIAPPDEIGNEICHTAIVDQTSIFNKRINNESVTILHMPSTASHFEYVLIIQLAKFNQKAISILTMICLYIAFCLLFGVFVSLKFSKKSSAPIDRIIRMISAAKGSKEPISKFSSLEKTLGTLFQRQQYLEDTLKKQQNDVKNTFLSKLIKGELTYSERNFAEAVTLDISLNQNDFYCVSIYAIIDYGTSFAPNGEIESQSVELAEYSVQNIVTELVSERRQCHVFVSEGFIVCLAFSCTSDAFEEDMQSAALTAVDFFAEKLFVHVAAAISHVATDFSSIASLYLEASTALEYKLLLNSPEKVVSSPVSSDYQINHVLNIHAYQLFVIAVQNGHVKETHAILISMIDSAINNPPSTAKLVKIRIASIVDLTFFALSKLSHPMAITEFGDIPNKILASKSFNELRSIVDLAFNLLYQDNSVIQKTAISMNIVTEYIREHGFDPSLSLTLLADHFKLNSSYLSRKFKNYVGIGVAEYIQLLRFERAKELLRTTDNTIPNIASVVGYYSAQAFSNAFKKATGMSPSQYKSSVHEHKI